MSLLATLRTVTPYHFLLFSALFGTTTYQSFYLGLITYRTIPLEHFAKLQGRIFPHYFAFQLAASSVLLLTTVIPSRAVYITLGLCVLTSGLCSLGLAPAMDVIKDKRDAQCKLENKGWRDPTASDDMKALNRSFAKLHGMSMASNMTFFVALLTYGVRLAAKVRI